MHKLIDELIVINFEINFAFAIHTQMCSVQNGKIHYRSNFHTFFYAVYLVLYVICIE